MSRVRRADPDAPVTPTEFDAAFSGLEGAGALLAAVSGGPDSTALMHALAAWRDRTTAAPRIDVATVDHGLRLAARDEAGEVAAAAGRLGLRRHLLVWSDRRPGPVSQAAARRARYRLLTDAAREIGAETLVTAHTMDDQAETILMRMAAGSGLTGVAGMAAFMSRAGLRHARPFVGFRKAALVATCRAEGWTFATDPSNADRRFARARWRDLTPGLAAEGLTPERLATFAHRAARADAALALAAGAALARWRAGPGEIDWAGLATEPPETVLRALAAALAERGADPARMRLDRLEACVEGLLAAVRQGREERRTLCGQVLSLASDGRLRIVAEPPRRRGRSSV